MNSFLQACKKKMQDAGINNAQKEIHWFLEKTSKLSQTNILLNNFNLNHLERSKLLNFVERRIKQEPFQYIINYAPFYGRDFYVNSNVLIPRPETETIINILKSENIYYRYALDIGTGSGNLAITISLENLASDIIAIEKSLKAVEIAKKNAAYYNIFNIKFLNRDFILNFINSTFDLIVCNPPYISIEEYSQLESTVKNYEPIDALTDFKDGLFFYKHIQKSLPNILSKNGIVLLEIGLEKHINQINTIFANYSTSWYKDYNGNFRVIKISNV